MGRAPCCDKANVKRGPWSPEEDATLKSYIEQNGTGGNWIALPQKIGLKRCGKSCRLRWLNYLRPNIKHGEFSEDEDNLICTLYLSIGSRWSIIAAQLPGRTDNDIKNYWNTRLKKKLLGKQRKEQQQKQATRARQVKKESDGQNFVAAVSMNLYPSYWPELPLHVAMSVVDQPHHQQQQQPQAINTQESIRNLIMKLGGRFSNDHEQQQNGNAVSNYQHPFDHTISSSNQVAQPFDPNNIPVDFSQLPNTPHFGLNDFQEFNELNDVFYGNALIDQFDAGFGDFSGIDMGNIASSNVTNSPAESTSWGDHMTSSVCPTPPPPLVVADQFEDFRQGLLQHCLFEEPRYIGFQQ